MEPQVFLVGAGPGHAGLLTLRAVECLARGDLVLYDRLVPIQLLEHAPAHAERICVTDLPGRHPERWPHVHTMMIEAARLGRRVVRLKGGDPFIFGRGGEEAEALRLAGIPYEIVPGVTAGIGAAICAGIPLTHRLHASAVAFVTGHEQGAKPGTHLDWQALARFPGTLVVYMGMARLGEVVHALIQHGKDPATPAAAIRQATTAHQQTLEAPLRDLPEAVRGAGLKAPAIVIIGSVVSLRPQLAWFEQRPLFGKQILVTRPRHQAAELMHRLAELGALPLSAPAIEVREPIDWAPVDQALAELRHYDWLVFTSANGVRAFFRRMRQCGRDLRWLGGLRLAAIGPATAAALREYLLEPDVIPSSYCSESLAAALKERVAGQRVLLARADRGREVLREVLAGVATVDQLAVYSQVDAPGMDAQILDQLRQGEIDYVTVTSSNIARVFAESLDAACRSRIAAGEVQLVSISPVTSAALRQLGLPVAAEASEYTMAGMVEALIQLARSKS
ncbi:MAG TPA: uroporphyrinogen-III C-methyltransferase [Gemmataceae bacterium]|nr:uroporphyrinogen-III C-methyltransferase [Gemmataceae bacterium]